MLQKTLISTDTMLCTALASHAHALDPPKGPIYLPLGHTISILVSTNYVGDAHDARGFSLPHTLHCYLPIFGLARNIGHGIFSTMLH